jgi:6-phosphogluconolactonase
MSAANTAAVRCLLLALLSLAGCGGGYGSPDEPYPVARTSFAYVTNVASGTVSIHDLDRDTGTLGRAKASALSGNGPLFVAAHPSRNLLYVANFNSRDVSEFRIDPVGGALTSIRAPVSTGAGRNPLFVSVHPSGGFALVGTLFDGSSTGKLTAYAVDPQGGSLTQVGDGVSAGFSPGSLAFSPSGRFAYVTDSLIDGVWTFSFDAATGALTNLHPDDAVPTGAFPGSIAMDRAGRFAYVVNNGSDTISMFAVNATTGTLTPTAGVVATGSHPSSIAVDPAGRFAYVTNERDNSISTYSIDAAAGTLRPVGAAVPTGEGPRSIVLEPAGKFAYVVNLRSNDVSVYAIDTTSGMPVPRGRQATGGLAPAFMAIVIPTP